MNEARIDPEVDRPDDPTRDGSGGDALGEETPLAADGDDDLDEDEDDDDDDDEDDLLEEGVSEDAVDDV